MDTRQYMSISAFSRLSGVSRKALIFYDNIGLFRPAHVGENGYRYYHYHQVDTITVIQSLKELGMSLEEIKRHLEKRTPESSIRLFQRQSEIMREKIGRLQQVTSMIDYRIRRTRRALALDPDAIELVQWEARPILLGEPILCREQQLTEDMWTRFFDLCDQREIPYGIPVGYLIDRDSLLAGQCDVISRLFVQTSDPEVATAEIPGGTYLVGYRRGYYGETAPLYRRLLDHIESAGLRVAGHAYEEYLLDEISTSEPDEYLAQVAIQVETQKTA